MGILRQFLCTLRRHGMVREGDRILVAVSGGPDSVALLHLFLQMLRPLGIDLHVAHFHHGLRGRESDQEETFVESLARRNGLPFSTGRLPPKPGTGSWEEYARIERYRFLRAVRDRIGADKVALGHQQNDQAETFLHRLLRGSGGQGLSAIHPVREGYLIRPLIETSREEILEYLNARGIPYRVDPSNRDRRYTRNRIRHDLLPKLAREFNPGIVRILAGTAERIREEDRLLDGLAGKGFSSTWIEADPPGLSARKLRDLSPPLRRRVILKAMERARGTQKRINSRHVDALLGLLEGEATGKGVCLPGGISARLEEDRITFREVGREAAPPPYREVLSIPGRCELPGTGISLNSRILPSGRFREDLRSAGRGTAYLDADHLHPPLVIRGRKRGDRFRPFGGVGEKKLKEFFIDRKVPVEVRDRWPLVTCGGDIVWVVGHQINHRYRVRPSTRNILILHRELKTSARTDILEEGLGNPGGIPDPSRGSAGSRSGT